MNARILYLITSFTCWPSLSVGHIRYHILRGEFCPVLRFRFRGSEVEDWAASDRCLACAAGISPISNPPLSFSQKTFPRPPPPPLPHLLHHLPALPIFTLSILFIVSSSQNWTIQVYLFIPDFAFLFSNAAPHLCFLLFAFTSFRLHSLHWPLLPWQSNNIPAIPFENFPPVQLQLFCSRTFLGFPCASSQCRSSPREGSRVENTLFISSDRSSLRYDAPLSYFHSTQPKGCSG